MFVVSCCRLERYLDSKSLWIKVIFYIIFISIWFFIYVSVSLVISEPLLCDHVGDLRNGTIARTSLLQPGETIKTLPHGTYNVTGGLVQIGNLGNGNITKVIGIAPHGIPPATFTYTPGIQWELCFYFIWITWGRANKG